MVIQSLKCAEQASGTQEDRYTQRNTMLTLSKERGEDTSRNNSNFVGIII
jgi:hypothetical protein